MGVGRELGVEEGGVWKREGCGRGRGNRGSAVLVSDN